VTLLEGRGFHKLHWLAEQALSWSGLPVVTVRPTVFLEGFFLLFCWNIRIRFQHVVPFRGGVPVRC
jgi:uncharacterized protein YbjT (DUF2867 family)